MRQGRSNYPKFQIHEKALSTTEMVCGSWKLSGTPKRDQSLFSLLLEIESRLRAEGRSVRLGSGSAVLLTMLCAIQPAVRPGDRVLAPSAACEIVHFQRVF